LLCPVLLFTTLSAIAADFEARYQNVEAAVSFYLPFDAIKQVTFEFLHGTASQTGHMHVVALRTAFVEVTVSLKVHQVQFIHQSLALQQRQSAIDGNAIDSGVAASRCWLAVSMISRMILR